MLKILMEIVAAGFPLTLRHVVPDANGGKFSVKFDIATVYNCFRIAPLT